MNSHLPLGSYIDRPVWLHDAEFLTAVNNGDLTNSINLMLVSIGYRVDETRALISHLIDKLPLGIMVGGSGASRCFEIAIDLLSSRPRSAQIMTRHSEGKDINESIQEFFQSFWPADERFDDWLGYNIFVGGYDFCVVKKYVLGITVTGALTPKST